MERLRRKKEPMINFNEPIYVENGMTYIRKAIENKKICGDGEYTKKCNAWMEEKTGSKIVYTVTATLLVDRLLIRYGLLVGITIVLFAFEFKHIREFLMDLKAGGK